MAVEKKINLHVVRNPVSQDSRVLKETGSLRDSGLFSSIDIAAFAAPGHAERENLDGRSIWRVPLATRRLPKDLASQSLKLAEWGARIVSAYKKAPVGVIHCHDLEPLPICVWLKRLTGARLVYDAHELETERAGHNALRKVLMRIAERRWIKSADAMITVSPSIRDWYRERYPDLPISLVRNVPERSPSILAPKNLRALLGVPGDALLFVYLGGLSKGRGIEKMVRAFGDTSVPHHLLVMGSGDLKREVDLAMVACRKIHYLPPVPPSQVLAYAAGADVGLCLYEDTCLNHRYCLPNKVFEFLLSGLPVLVSRLPDLTALVENLDAGWLTDGDVGSIVRTLRSITRDAWARARHGLNERTRNLGWHAESQALLSAYHEMSLPR